MASLSTPEHDLLGAARGGDRRAYDMLVAPYDAQLHAHCYRMLGSVHDAEDALQDALLRAWQGLPNFEGRGSLRAWLFKVATNASLRLLERRPPRVPRIDDGPTAPPLGESIWIEPYPDGQIGLLDGLATPEACYEQRESVELAFTAAVQHLSAHQRAVLLLHDVLGFSAREVAATLNTTEAAVNSALQRARRSVAERVPASSQQATMRSLGDQRTRQIVERFIDAWDRVDVEALVAMLTDDVTWSMPPELTAYRGKEVVAAWLARKFTLRWRRLPARANGQLAVGAYLWDEVEGRYNAVALDILTLRGERIEAVTAFLMPGALRSVGLPAHLD